MEVLKIDKENERIERFVGDNDRKTVVVQGLGFVGSAMAAALCGVKDGAGRLIYNVIGVDLADEKNYWKIDAVKNGRCPIVSKDPKMESAYKQAYQEGNLTATASQYSYARADVVIVDIHLDINREQPGNPYNASFSFEEYKSAVGTIADNIEEGTLVVVETTVPPGTTDKVIYPVFKESFSKRGMDIDKLYLAYSYERVMPGKDYLNSIVNFYRVYSGINAESKSKVKEFLETFINTKDFPLFEASSPTAAEMAKVLENSFRAMNIAFIQEWSEYAQDAGVNLYEVVDAIRMRPTHKNIMSPGFGVGGYCLTKDPLLADWSYKNFFRKEGHLEMSLRAVAVNDIMPDHTFSLLKDTVKDLKNRSVVILGVSYRNDVGDTRNSPAGFFYDKCKEEGAEIFLHDSLIDFWKEKNIVVGSDINVLKNVVHDIVIFAVGHSEYSEMSADDILSIFKGVKVIIDANNVLTDDKAKELSEEGVKVIGIGKGHWKFFGERDE